MSTAPLRWQSEVLAAIWVSLVPVDMQEYLYFAALSLDPLATGALVKYPDWFLTARLIGSSGASTELLLYYLLYENFSCGDQLFVTIFHSFKAGIVNTISASHDENCLYEKYIDENISSKLNHGIWLIDHVSKTFLFWFFNDFSFCLEIAWKRTVNPYTADIYLR